MFPRFTRLARRPDLGSARDFIGSSRGQGPVRVLPRCGGLAELALSIAITSLVASAVMNARATGAEGERRSSETESFSRIMRALSRSVSPDAVVEAIVHELGRPRRPTTWPWCDCGPEAPSWT